MRLFALFLLLVPASGFAFRLDPMVQEVPISRPQASATYTVENNTTHKVAVQFEVRRRLVDIEGKEERPEAKGFLVYPEQMQLEPGERRNVRVNWIGDSLPSTEQAYRFVASQLPIDFGGKEKNSARKVSLKFLIEYVASLYLVPPRAKSKMKLVKHSVNQKGELEIHVANEGTAHQLLERMDIALTSGGKAIRPEPEQLNRLRTENVLPGGERILRLPLPRGVSTKDLEVSVKFGS